MQIVMLVSTFIYMYINMTFETSLIPRLSSVCEQLLQAIIASGDLWTPVKLKRGLKVTTRNNCSHAEESLGTMPDQRETKRL